MNITISAFFSDTEHDVSDTTSLAHRLKTHTYTNVGCRVYHEQS
jgi:hypothetical protein